jgi:hypothetical protein
MPVQDLEMNGNSAMRVGKAGNRGYSWYSRMSKVKKIILWLLALFVILGIALGVGLGVGLQNRGTPSDDD